jgi:hypothetical protein
MNSGVLFAKGDLSASLRSVQEQMTRAIENYDAEDFLRTDVDKLVASFIRNANIESLSLDESAVRPVQRPTKIDVSQRFEYAWDGAGPLMVDGIEVSLYVPFKGDAQLLHLRPSRSTFSPPRGHVEGHEVRLSCAATAHDANRIEMELRRELESLKQYASWSRTDTVNHNATLVGIAQSAVEARRNRLLAMPNVAAIFASQSHRS